jgi:hypothetical protein
MEGKILKYNLLLVLVLYMVPTQTVWGQHKYEISAGGYYQLHCDIDDDLYGFQVMGAYRFTPKLRVGIGTGVGKVVWGYKPANQYERNKGMKDDQKYLPLSAQVKYNLFDKNFSPYIGMEVGYCFSLSKGYRNLGPTCKPHVGLDVSLNNFLKCYCQLGCNYQSLSRDIYHDGSTLHQGGGSTIGYGGPTAYENNNWGMLLEFALGLTVLL